MTNKIPHNMRGKWTWTGKAWMKIPQPPKDVKE